MTMTARELIQELMKVPPESPISVSRYMLNNVQTEPLTLVRRTSRPDTEPIFSAMTPEQLAGSQAYVPVRTMTLVHLDCLEPRTEFLENMKDDTEMQDKHMTLCTPTVH